MSNEPVVRSSTRDWATECALADAGRVLDTPASGNGINAVLNTRAYPLAYQFSNGRCFADGPKPHP